MEAATSNFLFIEQEQYNRAHGAHCVTWIIQSAIQIFIQAYHIVLMQSILFP